MSLLDELKKRQMNGFAPAAPAPTAAPTPMAAPAPAVGPTIANAPITFPGLNELGAAGAAEFNAPQPETYNAATLGAPDFDEPYIIPQAAQAYGNVPVNMPSNPLDAGNQIAPAFRTAQDAATPAAQPPNALLDLAEREGALGPKLTDIFSGRETAIAEGGTPKFLPQPTSVAGQAAQAPAPQAGSGGLISFDTGARAGQTFFGDETGVGAVTQGVADQINQGFDDTYGTRSAGDISITGPDGQAIDPNSTRYDPARLTPAMQANVDAGRPPNVSASQVAGAERQMQQQEVERAADRAAAEYGKNLPLNGQSIGARDEKVAEFRAAYLMGQQGEAGKGSGGMTAYQAATLAQKDRDFNYDLLKEQQGEAAAKAESQKRASLAASDAMRQNQNIMDTAKEAGKNIGITTTGAGGALLGIIPGTGAFDQKSTVDTLQADAAFTALQNMRDSSPTGGALGQVSERELKLLSSNVRNLDHKQSPDQFRKNLAEYVKLRNQSMANMYRAYATDFSAKEANAAFGVNGIEDFGAPQQGGGGGGSRHAGDQDHGAKVETHFQGN